MTEQIRQTLADTAIATFEQLAFMFAFPQESEDAPAPDSALLVTIPFSGPFCGSLEMKVSGDVVAELAANMLGIEDEEEVSAAQHNDAIKEALNVICGNLLPAIAGNGELFDIGPPEIAAAENVSNSKPELKSMGRINLAFDEGQCALELFVDQPLA